MVIDIKKLSKEVKALKDSKTKSRVTLTIKEAPKADYVPIYFQTELKEEKKKLFFD
jgi:hypothetical protein